MHTKVKAKEHLQDIKENSSSGEKSRRAAAAARNQRGVLGLTKARQMQACMTKARLRQSIYTMVKAKEQR